MQPDNEWIGAMGHSSRLDLYDPLVRFTVRERRFKRRLLAVAAIQNGFHVLDLGCGTGTLAVMLKRGVPRARVAGIDADPAAIALAQRKAARHGMAIDFLLGLGQALPFRDRSFDRVLSTLFFHHLTHAGKRAAFSEILRILKPGGELHLADFGRPANALMRAGFSLVRKFDGMETTEDNADGRLPAMIGEAGLEQVLETASYSILFGTIRLYAATAPAGGVLRR
jgi:ubiquinone/menaquinone biosynthesis C-methylase UbiE